jgi:hypothetical protein
MKHIKCAHNREVMLVGLRVSYPEVLDGLQWNLELKVHATRYWASLILVRNLHEAYMELTNFPKKGLVV